MILSPFTIVCDTREQLPFSFQNIRIDRKKAFVMTQRYALPTGDYSITGYEDKVCVERKSLQDLYQTLGRERERFMRELERMEEMTYAAVVIEATWQQIADPTNDPLWYSKMHPNSIIGTIVACAGEFPKTRWKATGNRANAEKMTFDILLKFYRNYDKEANNPLENEILAGETTRDIESTEHSRRVCQNGNTVDG
jgi:ERCC4-type nuclease